MSGFRLRTHQDGRENKRGRKSNQLKILMLIGGLKILGK